MKKSLLKDNPYLKDTAQRKLLLRRSLVSSFAIEGITLEEEPVCFVKEEQQAFKVHKPSKSTR